jgi:hypothetical protein
VLEVEYTKEFEMHSGCTDAILDNRIKAFSETDQTEDLENGILKVIAGRADGPCATHADVINQVTCSR